MLRLGRFLPFLALAASGTQAFADPPTSPITDSSYSIELYDGVAIGNTAVVGMGGATTALAIGSSGTLFNPSAPAVKPTTDTDTWSWDYHIDYLNGSLSTDYDNNGFTSADGGTSVFTGGIGLRVGEWAGAITATQQYAPVDAMVTTPQGDVPLQASTFRIQGALARWVPRLDTAIGVSLQTAEFDFKPDCDGPGCESLFNVSGAGLELGATWAPRRQSFRVGAALATPIAGGDVTGCDPSDCVGWTLPERIVTPWRLAVGGAYRFSPSDWNQLVGGYFRDEKSVTVATDLILWGSSPNAFGLEAFGDHMLQRSGRHASVSVRAGVEYEWLPGRLRVRGGTYWEPGRFVGVSGRQHLTFGVELRVFQFRLLKRPRRGRISLTADLAERYSNGGLSIGFWH
ncbi:MAG: hypothetical protein HOV81_14665 [Kofleriaceae bacterium]|nr:hypothetical protein [Kofleriaceae bacterium]